MIYLAFFVFCVAIVVIAVLFIDARGKALAVGGLGLGLAYLVELNGVRSGQWCYNGVDSVLFVTGIPIEILFGYFTAAFFLVVVVTYLPRVSTEELRGQALKVLCLLLGVVLLAYAYATGSISVLVGWSLLAVYGLSVARDRTVPLAVGVGAFLADWAVEGALTAGTEYYATGWNPSIGLVFMFAGMFMSGMLTHEPVVLWRRPHGTVREDRPSSQSPDPSHPDQGVYY